MKVDSDAAARDHLPEDALRLKPAVESFTHTPAGGKVRTEEARARHVNAWNGVLDSLVSK